IVVQAMRHISRLTALGIAVGVFGAWVATRLLQTMLFNVKPAEPGDVRRGNGGVCGRGAGRSVFARAAGGGH
ncbi:MAG: hypothetical protein ACRD1M_07430, partial [Terriglobales bacterium]